MTTLENNTAEYLPPPDPPGISKWIRDNLLNGWFNTLLTFLSIGIIYYSISGLLTWVFTQANWAVVSNFPTLYAVGQYPRDELWRIGFGLSFLAFLLGASWQNWGGILREISLFLAGLISYAVH